MIQELRENIRKIGEDCFSNEKYISLASITEYIYLILTSLYDKKYCDKILFKPFIKQLIAEEYSKFYGKHYNDFKNVDRSNQVEYLKTLPQPAQRTPEWYKLKDDSIGASESATVFGDNPYQTKNFMILKKCGYSEAQFKTSIHCQHGIKYEPIIQKIYCDKKKTRIIEFGSITHPTMSMVSASPDGITPEGVMIEIKAPLSREITGIPPKYYWYQMQQQLQVCGLDRVDFIECKISEYLNYNEFRNDVGEDENMYYNKDGMYKGIIIEYINLGENNDNGYIYPDNFLKMDEIFNWMTTNKKEIEKSDNRIFNRYIFWKLDIYSECTIWRDDWWWEHHKHMYVEFWEKVLYHREHGYTELLPKKQIRKNKEDTIENCMIISED